MNDLMTRTPFESLFSNHHWSPFRELLQGKSDAFFAPAVDIEETENSYLMSADLPGVQKSDLKLELIGNQLVISGERRQEKTEGKGSRKMTERTYGSFQRAFSLPDNVQANQIEAGFQDGVLRIVIPKTKAVKSKQIPVQAGKPGTSSKTLSS